MSSIAIQSTTNQRSEPLHIVTQNNQPYGSMRRCCEYCGRMCWPGMKGSAERWTDDWVAWETSGEKCTLDVIG